MLNLTGLKLWLSGSGKRPESDWSASVSFALEALDSVVASETLALQSVSARIPCSRCTKLHKNPDVRSERWYSSCEQQTQACNRRAGSAPLLQCEPDCANN